MPSGADRLALAVMAKRPQPGRTKTRLCPPLAPEQAAGLYEAFLMDVLRAAGQVDGLQLTVAVSPPDDESLAYFRRIAPPGTLLLPVEAPTIGRCLEAVLTGLLARGYELAAAMSSDCPTVSAGLIRLAFERLRAADVVLCPGDDGGYYWIGVRARCPDLFGEEIPWSTSGVAASTYSRALGLSIDLAAPILDVDNAADLRRLIGELARLPREAAPHTRAALLQLNLDQLEAA